MKLESTGICEPKPSLTEEDAQAQGGVPGSRSPGQFSLDRKELDFARQDPLVLLGGEPWAIRQAGFGVDEKDLVEGRDQPLGLAALGLRNSTESLCPQESTCLPTGFGSLLACWSSGIREVTQ